MDSHMAGAAVTATRHALGSDAVIRLYHLKIPLPAVDHHEDEVVDPLVMPDTANTTAEVAAMDSTRAAHYDSKAAGLRGSGVKKSAALQNFTRV
jgi:hypothetical protein